MIDIGAASDAALTERGEMLASALQMDVFRYCPIPKENARYCELSDSRQHKCERRLRDYSDTLRRANVSVETHTETVASICEATLKCINTIRPGIVLTASATANRTYALDADQLVGELLQNTHCDVWVVQRTVENDRRTLMAAVNSDAKSIPTRIRDNVLSKTAKLAERLSDSAHVVHTYRISRATELAIGLLPHRMPGNNAEEIESNHVKAAYRASERFDYRRDFIHVIQGELLEEIRRLVASMKIDAVVAGATSRGTLRRWIATDYPKQLVDCLPCDVLIVRP